MTQNEPGFVSYQSHQRKPVRTWVDQRDAGGKSLGIVEREKQSGRTRHFERRRTFRVPAILASLAEDGKASECSKPDHVRPACYGLGWGRSFHFDLQGCESRNHSTYLRGYQGR